MFWVGTRVLPVARVFKVMIFWVLARALVDSCYGDLVDW